MTKHGGEEKTEVGGSGKNPGGNSSSPPREGKPLISWEKSKLTPDNIMEFSDQLQQLLEYVQTLKDVAFYTYEYPTKLSDKLEEEAIELKNLFRDVRAAAIDIERLQKQRCLIKKEKSFASKKLDKLKEEEMRELESIICAYAKPLHSKWESIKNTQKPDVLENFMNEVTGKHRAIEILQELVRRKLAKISKKNSVASFTIKKNVSSTNANKVKSQDKTVSNWNLTPFADRDKFGQNIDKVMRGTTDRDAIRMNRRKRQKELREERRRLNLDVTTTTSAGNNNNNNNNNAENNGGGLDLQLIPIENFPGEEIDDVVATRPKTTAIASSRTPPIINIEFISDDDSVSLSSSDFTIENFIQSGSREVNSELQTEMRNVLQALFGGMRRIPPGGGLSISRNRHSNTGNDLRSSRTASN